MPRYFFHTADGGRHPDDTGVVLRDVAAARREAIRFAGSLLDEEPDLLCNSRDLRVEVTNSRQRLLFTVITLTVDATGSQSGPDDPEEP